MGLERQVVEPQVATSADHRQHLGHRGPDAVATQRPVDRHPVVTVPYEICLPHLVDVDRWQVLTAPDGRGDALEALPTEGAGRTEEPVEAAAAVGGPHDRVQVDLAQAAVLLATPTEGGDNLVEGQHDVQIAATAPQPREDPAPLLSAPGSGEVVA